MEPGQLINIAVTAAVFIWLYVQKRGDKTAERLDEHESRIKLNEKNLAVLESLLASAPKHEDLSRIYDAVNRVSEQVNQMIGVTRSQGEFLKVLVNRLTEKGLS